jgi:hypothetical protein
LLSRAIVRLWQIADVIQLKECWPLS